MSLGDAAQECFLHEIVSPAVVAREGSRIAPQSRDLLFDESVKFGHLISPRARIATPDGERPNGRCRSMTNIKSQNRILVGCARLVRT
jgi:hypothetical protein